MLLDKIFTFNNFRAINHEKDLIKPVLWELCENTLPPPAKITYINKNGALLRLITQIRSNFRAFFSIGHIGRKIVISLIFILWLYLFFPFRLVGFPIFFGQIEEWICASILLSIIVTLLLIPFLKMRRITFRFIFSDILLLIYLIYILFRFDASPIRQEHLFSVFSLTLLYITVRINYRFHLRFLFPILTVSLLFQVFFAFHPQAITRMFIPTFTGLFHNTGIWGGFVGIVFVGIYGLMLFSKRNKFLLTGLLSVSFSLLIYSQSRAAWIGVLGGCTVLTLVLLWKKYRSRMILPVFVTLLLSLPLFIFTGSKWYNLKSDSASGRIYIWKISSQMFLERPWFGMGIDKFKSNYMNYQAAYFTQNPNSLFSRMADEITEPFSEPLKIGIEQGITGLLIALSIFLSAVLSASHKHLRVFATSRLLVISVLFTLLLFSCFSYPFYYIQFHFLLFAGLAMLSASGSGHRITIRAGRVRMLTFVSFVLFTFYVSITGINYAVNLKQLHRQIVNWDTNAPEKALTVFASIEPTLKTNAFFLTSYAHFLSLNNEHERAIEKWVLSLSYKASYYTCISLGSNYDRIGETENALACWRQASYMIPSRFEPLYLQIDAYHRSGQHSLADSLTTIFLQKERKVDHIRIDRMMRDVRQWRNATPASSRKNEGDELTINH